MKNRVYKGLFAIAMLGALAFAFTGCKSKKAETAGADTCFVYADGLLDDLCALEYLSKRYDHAVILLQNPEGLKDSPYGSPSVTDGGVFLEAVHKWFPDAVSYADGTDVAKADFYLLAPLTEYAALLKKHPEFGEKNTLMMAGDEKGPDGAGEDWNAIMDIEAYRYVSENVSDLFQVTRPDCEGAYEKNGYPFEAEYLDEYISRMSAIDENVCCYDLQAVALRDNNSNP